MSQLAEVGSALTLDLAPSCEDAARINARGIRTVVNLTFIPYDPKVVTVCYSSTRSKMNRQSLTPTGRFPPRRHSSEVGAWLVVYYRPIFLVSFLKEVFLRSVILFQSDVCFMRKDLRFRLRSFEFKRCGKVDKKNRRSFKICSGASCADHSTRSPSSQTP
jgi:hypothetical protein